MERILLKPGITIRGRWYGGEYRVIKLICSGGTARVYLVRDLSDGRKYALKLGSDMAGVEREYKVLSSLSSIDYVPRVYVRDDCTIEGRKRFFLLWITLRRKPEKAMQRAGYHKGLRWRQLPSPP